MRKIPNEVAVSADSASMRPEPEFFVGDAMDVLSGLSTASVDCIVTSPPYWSKREYAGGGIGLEKNHLDYIAGLVSIIDACQRVLKPTGSLWLNIGDSYKGKQLLGIPWRVAIQLTDSSGWILRNSIIWNKIKSGMDNSRDRLGNKHEMVFHLVRQPKYYYDADAIRSKPRESKIVNGSVVSATGVSGVRYKRQIELSTELSPAEKKAAFTALNHTLETVRAGKISDFRMVIRGQQRTTHSDSEKLSGRAKELRDKGHYFLRYHPKGGKPSDVWDILPEDTQKRQKHFAAYPEDLCRIPILATCPPEGVVLDPFCGTGTTMKVASELGRRSIGIDISSEYIEMAKHRCRGE